MPHVFTPTSRGEDLSMDGRKWYLVSTLSVDHMKLAFIVPSTVELLDLSGPVQVFVEAQFQGFQTDIEFFSYLSEPVSTAGVGFANIASYKDAHLAEGDYLFFKE